MKTVLPELLRRLLGFGNTEESTRLAPLERQLGHRFKQRGLLSHALTHKSSLRPETADWTDSNERLEFLGDAVLDILVTEHLYTRYPDRSEGQLSKIKSLVVSRKILGRLAVDCGIGPFMIMGASEKKNIRHSVLSNAFEALLGALYLDAGLDCVRTFLHKVLFCRIEEFVADKNNINFKSRILELSQRDGFGIPAYRVLSTSGPDHNKVFTVGIEVGGKSLGSGSGSNKKQAEQDAARSALNNYSKEYILTNPNGEQEQ
jgi:ribonuclease-3